MTLDDIPRNCSSCKFGPNICHRRNSENIFGINGSSEMFFCWKGKTKEEYLKMIEEINNPKKEVQISGTPYDPYHEFSKFDVEEMMDFIMNGDGNEEGNYLEKELKNQENRKNSDYSDFPDPPKMERKKNRKIMNGSDLSHFTPY